MALRAYHAPVGDPCTFRGRDGYECSLPEHCHRWYKPGTMRGARPEYYVGIDGEGQGRKEHRYVMLAYSSEDSQHRNAIQASEGDSLSTVECLDFILSIPNNAKIFAFSFGYDLTKILTDVDDESLYRLARPELRKRKPGYEKYGPKPVVWGDYVLNKVSSKFSVQKGKRRRVIWDTFAFYQSKFTTAIADWKVGTEDVIDRMRTMKDRRSEFDKLSRSEILSYCYDECAYMAQLAHKLTEAHTQVGLKLRSYFGAGSSASAILKRFGVDKMKRETPEGMNQAVASAFFGGRFENGVIGEVPGPVWGYDISSAYPYQLTFLPCLDCGRWELTKDESRMDGGMTALVRYFLPPRHVRPKSSAGQAWGPLPFRTKDGSIAFPSSSGGGWVWWQEFNAAKSAFGNVQFREAWIYKTECDHRPFASVPEFYLQRLRIGKEGAGIVIKLACNSIYGKLAQSVGTNPPFQCWIWAGMVTSGCRAQILEMLALHKDRSNMLMVATDGIYSREKIDPPKPRETGTQTDHNKPLGGWERKEVLKGVFAARPGIYFPRNPSEEELKQVRARGVGRAVMLASWKLVVDAWKRGETSIKLPDVTRFYGLKSTITKSQSSYTRSDRYGQWRTRPIEMSFDPMPKREKIRKDGSLTLRSFPQTLQSTPYKNSLSANSPEGLLLRAGLAEALEQADGEDFADYETE